MQRFDFFIKYYGEYCTLEIVYIVLHIMYSALYAFLLTRLVTRVHQNSQFT